MRIDTLDKLIAVLILQKKNLPTYKTEVGATAADITDVTEQLACLQFIKGFSDVVDEDKKTVTGIKQQCFNGAVNEDVAAMPVFSTDPAPPMTSGILNITLERNKRFKLGPGYNNEIGIALGIASPEGSEAVDPTPSKPSIEVFPAATGYMFTIVATNRGESDQWEISMQTGEGKWMLLKTVTGKSADVTIVPTTPGKPEQFQVRIQLKKKNENYGEVSNPVYVTVNP